MNIVWHHAMAKRVAQIRKSGNKRTLKALKSVISMFEIYDRDSRMLLQTHFKDHPLKGDKSGKREMHLAKDDLLIYKVHEPDIIELLDVINHEELRKRK